MSSEQKKSNHDEEPVSNATHTELTDEELEGISAAGINTNDSILGLGENQNMSPLDIMKMQSQLQRSNLQQEMITNTADKSADTINKLFQNE